MMAKTKIFHFIAASFLSMRFGFAIKISQRICDEGDEFELKRKMSNIYQMSILKNKKQTSIMHLFVWSAFIRLKANANKLLFIYFKRFAFQGISRDWQLIFFFIKIKGIFEDPQTHLHSNVASVQNVIFTFKIADKLRFTYMPFLTRAIFTPFHSSIHTNSRLHLSLVYHQCCEIKSMIHFTALWLAPIHVAGHCCCCYRNLLLCRAYLRCKMISAR